MAGKVSEALAVAGGRAWGRTGPMGQRGLWGPLRGAQENHLSGVGVLGGWLDRSFVVRVAALALQPPSPVWQAKLEGLKGLGAAFLTDTTGVSAKHCGQRDCQSVEDAQLCQAAPSTVGKGGGLQGGESTP